eukprot:scaffold659_cov329-Prasinococcus_capsulatus_cf.AAC.44
MTFSAVTATSLPPGKSSTSRVAPSASLPRACRRQSPMPHGQQARGGRQHGAQTASGHARTSRPASSEGRSFRPTAPPSSALRKKLAKGSSSRMPSYMALPTTQPGATTRTVAEGSGAHEQLRASGTRSSPSRTQEAEVARRLALQGRRRGAGVQLLLSVSLPPAAHAQRLLSARRRPPADGAVVTTTSSSGSSQRYGRGRRARERCAQQRRRQ